MRAWKQSLYVCGIDEVGRGCLFGPMVTAAAILPIGTSFKLLKDSKVMSEKDRDIAYEWIMKNAYTSVAIVSSYEIDSINIYQSTLYAMKKAFIQLVEVTPIVFEKIRYLMVDAMPLRLDYPYTHKKMEIHTPNYGESVSISIAAASIIAKVTRDRLIVRMAEMFPHYELEKHKGYGTKAHSQRIQRFGASILHRSSFLSKNVTGKTYDKKKQQSIF